jgi:hypothetical protein
MSFTTLDMPEVARIGGYVDALLDNSPLLLPPIVNEIEGKTVSELREMLGERCLKVSGKKAVLQQRLINEQPHARKIRCRLIRRVISIVRRLIEDYGDDGYGDKPEGVCRVEYWLAHIEPAHVID